MIHDGLSYIIDTTACLYELYVKTNIISLIQKISSSMSSIRTSILTCSVFALVYTEYYSYIWVTPETKFYITISKSVQDLRTLERYMNRVCTQHTGDPRCFVLDIAKCLACIKSLRKSIACTAQYSRIQKFTACEGYSNNRLCCADILEVTGPNLGLVTA
jgi:hypothetical protein